MGKLIRTGSLVEHDDELDIKGPEEGKVYPMSGIKIDKGFYSLFELKRRYRFSEGGYLAERKQSRVGGKRIDGTSAAYFLFQSG